MPVSEARYLDLNYRERRLLEKVLPKDEQSRKKLIEHLASVPAPDVQKVLEQLAAQKMARALVEEFEKTKVQPESLAQLPASPQTTARKKLRETREQITQIIRRRGRLLRLKKVVPIQKQLDSLQEELVRLQQDETAALKELGNKKQERRARFEQIRRERIRQTYLEKKQRGILPRPKQLEQFESAKTIGGVLREMNNPWTDRKPPSIVALKSFLKKATPLHIKLLTRLGIKRMEQAATTDPELRELWEKKKRSSV